MVPNSSWNAGFSPKSQVRCVRFGTHRGKCASPLAPWISWQWHIEKPIIKAGPKYTEAGALSYLDSRQCTNISQFKVFIWLQKLDTVSHAHSPRTWESNEGRWQVQISPGFIMRIKTILWSRNRAVGTHSCSVCSLAWFVWGFAFVCLLPGKKESSPWKMLILLIIYNKPYDIKWRNLITDTNSVHLMLHDRGMREKKGICLTHTHTRVLLTSFMTITILFYGWPWEDSSYLTTTFFYYLFCAFFIISWPGFFP